MKNFHWEKHPFSIVKFMWFPNTPPNFHLFILEIYLRKGFSGGNPWLRVIDLRNWLTNYSICVRHYAIFYFVSNNVKLCSRKYITNRSSKDVLNVQSFCLVIASQDLTHSKSCVDIEETLRTWYIFISHPTQWKSLFLLLAATCMKILSSGSRFVMCLERFF